MDTEYERQNGLLPGRPELKNATNHSVRITILADNRAEPGLLCEHGFSCWIEVNGRKLLFDTGQGRSLAANSEKLGIDLRSADALILSHGHYDHTGGLPLITELTSKAVICAHPGVTDIRFAVRNGSAKPISMPTDARIALVKHPIGVRFTTRSLQITDSLGVTGVIPRQNDYENTGGPFFFDTDGTVPDPILDDLALWLRTEQGLVVVVGCCHAGIVNTLRHVAILSSEPKIHAVLGGFHLAEASEKRLAHTLEELQEINPDMIVPCHCTGDVAVERLIKTFGDRVVPGSAGSVFRLGRAHLPESKEL